MNGSINTAVPDARPPSLSGCLHGSPKVDRSLFVAQWLVGRRKLLNLCLRWTGGNISEAEDLLSDACVRVLEHESYALAAVGNATGFWTTVINNLGRDRVRRVRRWKFDWLDDDVDSSVPLAAQTISAEQQVCSKERLESAMADLECLNEKQRKAVLLRCTGLGYSGIGEMLCTSEANARKLVEVARRSLHASSKRWAPASLPKRASQASFPER